MSSAPEHPDQLPEGLTRDLHALYARDLRVPESIDASILHEARAGFAKRRRFRLALRGAVIASGAVAAALVVIAIKLGGSDNTTQPALAALPEDVDRSGRVDILDAFVVARLVDLQEHLDPPAYDVNGDGKVDRADVDRIAMAAVDTSAEAPDDGRPQ